MVKSIKNYYIEIDTALQAFENFRSYQPHTVDWICDRIAWAWKFKKITKAQMEELSDRIIEVMNSSMGFPAKNI